MQEGIECWETLRSKAGILAQIVFQRERGTRLNVTHIGMLGTERRRGAMIIPFLGQGILAARNLQNIVVSCQLINHKFPWLFSPLLEKLTFPPWASVLISCMLLLPSVFFRCKGFIRKFSLSLPVPTFCFVECQKQCFQVKTKLHGTLDGGRGCNDSTTLSGI